MSLVLVVGTLSALGVDPCGSGFGGSRVAKATEDAGFYSFTLGAPGANDYRVGTLTVQKPEDSTPTTTTITFEPWGHADRLPFDWTRPTTGVYLTEDVTVSGWSSPILLPGHEYLGNVMNLCLNGHTITLTSGNIDLNEGTLNLFEDPSNRNNPGMITITGTGLNHSIIKVSHRSGSRSPGTFNMYGGKLCGNTHASNGGGVLVDGDECVFNMYGGSIENNYALYSGGGVDLSSYSCYFNMYGGKISGNTLNNGNGSGGGGVAVGSSSCFTMYGGTITGNYASAQSSGVSTHYGGGVYSSLGGTTRIYGGVIENNYLYDNGRTTTHIPDVNLPNGKPFEVKGAPVIGDVYLGYDDYNPSELQSMIKVVDTLQNGASIGVSVRGNLEDNNPRKITNTAAGSLTYNDPSFFHAYGNQNNAVVKNTSDNQLYLVSGIKPTISGLSADASVTRGESATLSLTATKANDGDALSYQWYSSASNTNTGGSPISGATTPSLSVPDTQTIGDKYYYCVVSETRTGFSAASVSSNPIKVTVTEPDPPAPQPVPPTNNTPSNPSLPSQSYGSTPSQPQPSLGNGLSGWSEIGNAITNIPDGGSLDIDMNGTITLPAIAISSIQGRDINLVLNMGGGIKWTINGNDLSGISGDVYLGVYLGTSGIPVEIINKLTGEREKINLMLSRDGGPGFRATLTIPLKPAWAGQVANLFNYNKVTENMDFVSSGTINPDGSADLVIGDKQPPADDASSVGTAPSVKSAPSAVTVPSVSELLKLAAADGSGQASSFYTIVIDDHSLDPNAKPEPTATPAVTPEPTVDPTPEPAQELTLSATSKQGKITLSWNEQTEASRYRIYQLIDGRKLLLKTIDNKKSQTNSLTIAKAFYAVKKKKKTTYHRKKTEGRKRIHLHHPCMYKQQLDENH
ncbi:MAG: hypothetical protein J5819_05310 [Eubacterium sp.]|nr:hypothetical protein [Eubacterium sp.]